MAQRRLKRPKAKGDNYEREIAHFLNDQLFGGSDTVTRAPLSGGGSHFVGKGGAADLVGFPDIWAELKRNERLKLNEAVKQAERGIKGRRSTDMMAVITRRNGERTGQSLVVMRMDDWLRLYRAYLERTGVKTHQPTENLHDLQDGAQPDLFAGPGQPDPGRQADGGPGGFPWDPTV